MDLSSGRKITPADYDAIRESLSEVIDGLKRIKRKLVHSLIDLDTMMSVLYDMEHAYILDEQYLVIYGIDSPWYARDDVTVLHEILVLRIAVSRDANFGIVPKFLERKAREAGCALTVVGTALAKADSALASLYSRHGFRPEATTLVKGA